MQAPESSERDPDLRSSLVDGFAVGDEIARLVPFVDASVEKAEVRESGKAIGSEVRPHFTSVLLWWDHGQYNIVLMTFSKVQRIDPSEHFLWPGKYSLAQTMSTK